MPINHVLPEQVVAAFGLESATIELLSGGRTNRTMRATGATGGAGVAGGTDIVVQQVKHGSLGDLLGVMENLVRVTSHLEWKRALSASGGDSWYPLLLPTTSGKPFLMDANGDVWRAFMYRPGLVVRRPQRADTMASIAAIFGRFTAETSDLVGAEGPDLLETTPGFHDLDRILAEFETQLEACDATRRADIGQHRERIDAILAALHTRIANDGLSSVRPRVVHNDTKLSNVLIDHDQGSAIAVLDLDLAMMGPVWHDVGDLVRSACWHLPGQVGPGCDVDLFDVIIGGYLQTAAPVLDGAEIATFATAGPRLAVELGLRYLTDHCRDVPRLRVDLPGGHLTRGLSNLLLAEEMLNAYDALRPVVDRFLSVNHMTT